MGITPPNVLGTPNPESSVKMSKIFGAPFGGTILGSQHGFDSGAVRLITPPNGLGSGGNCFEFGDSVADGEHGSPVVCWALALTAAVR